MVDFPPLAQQLDMDTTISILPLHRVYFFDSHPQKGLLVSGWLPPVPSPVDPQHRTALAFARLKVFLQIPHGLSLLGRL